MYLPFTPTACVKRRLSWRWFLSPVSWVAERSSLERGQTSRRIHSGHRSRDTPPSSRSGRRRDSSAALQPLRGSAHDSVSRPSMSINASGTLLFTKQFLRRPAT
jgi:hypothetical protein